MTNNPVKAGPRILVVDDHDVSSQHALSALGLCNGEVRLENNAEGALRQALAWQPDVICLDLHLPDLDGIELTRRIRALWPAGTTLPRIILLTGDRSVLGRRDLVPLKIDQILIKPASGLQLREAIQKSPGNDSSQDIQYESGTELRQLFRAELEQRLPELDRCIALADRRHAARILHQLIASAAITRERELESCLRSLAAQCSDSDSAAGLANCYYTLLESSREFLSRQCAR